MHFPILKDESYCSWIMVWNEDIHHGDNQFSLRIINSKGRENIFYLQFSKKEIIKVVNLNELVDKDSDNHYIAQIESVCANYHATLLTHNKNTDHIAVDHLTGG
jgi:ATP-dependent 26S proteasome regulatory subunit